VLSSRSGDYFVVQSSGTSNRVTWKVSFKYQQLYVRWSLLEQP
jgi:hypothetical protein